MKDENIAGKIYLAVLTLIALAMIFYHVAQVIKCEADGGRYLRGLFFWECVHIK